MRDADITHLRNRLPLDVQEALRKHEEEDTTESQAYREADRIFARRHIFRKDPWPEWLLQALRSPPANMVDMKGWDIRERLGEIGLSTLVTCGRYDMSTPSQAEVIHQTIPGSEIVVFEKSSHYPHGEETERYLAVLHYFMTRVESGTSAAA
jgi:pimeloyl-ACP methyl ester carboxylesterase